MVHAKNYETVSTFVKGVQKKLWPLFSGHGVYACKVACYYMYELWATVYCACTVLHNL